MRKMPKELSTYYGYTNGYDPRVLRLGNMALDYVNPRTREPYIHDEIRLRDSLQIYEVTLTPKAVSRTSRNGRLPALKKIAT